MAISLGTYPIFRQTNRFFVETPLVQGHFQDLQDLPVRIRGAFAEWDPVRKFVVGSHSQWRVFHRPKRQADVDFWRVVVKWMILTYFDIFCEF